MPQIVELEPGDAGVLARAFPCPAEGIRMKRESGRALRAEEPGRSVRLDVGIKVCSQGRDERRGDDLHLFARRINLPSLVLQLHANQEKRSSVLNLFQD